MPITIRNSWGATLTFPHADDFGTRVDGGLDILNGGEIVGVVADKAWTIVHHGAPEDVIQQAWGPGPMPQALPFDPENDTPAEGAAEGDC